MNWNEEVREYGEILKPRLRAVLRGIYDPERTGAAGDGGGISSPQTRHGQGPFGKLSRTASASDK